MQRLWERESSAGWERGWCQEPVLMGGHVPFSLQLLRGQVVTRILIDGKNLIPWEAGTCFHSVVFDQTGGPQPRVGTYSSVSLAGVFVNICIVTIFVGRLLRALIRRRALCPEFVFC